MTVYDFETPAVVYQSIPSVTIPRANFQKSSNSVPTGKSFVSNPSWPGFPGTLNFDKRLVKLFHRVKIGHSFLQCVKSVPLYHFQLAYVVLDMTVGEFFESRFWKSKNRPFQSLESFLTNLENQLQSAVEVVPKASKHLFLFQLCL